MLYANIKFTVSPTINSGSDILLMVKSARHNFKKRSVVRQTWGNLKFLEENIQKPHNLTTQVFFIIGKAASDKTQMEKKIATDLESEIDSNKDIVMGDFVDSYRNLSYKSIGAFKWALNEFHGDFKYLLLFDDDISINMIQVGSLLKDLNNKKVIKIDSPHTGFPFYEIAAEDNANAVGVIGDITNGLHIGNVNHGMPPIRQPGLV